MPALSTCKSILVSVSIAGPARPTVLPTPFITSRQFHARGGSISGQTLIFTDKGEPCDVRVPPVMMHVRSSETKLFG